MYSIDMDYQTKTKLILPFRGTWMVSNGGRTVETNNHTKFAGGDGPKNQLYAYDFRRGHTKQFQKLLLNLRVEKFVSGDTGLTEKR